MIYVLRSAEPRSAASDARDHVHPKVLPPAEAAYANDWSRFLSWCEEKQAAAIAADPETVAQFLEAEAALGYSLRTISHRLSAIGYMHRRNRALPPLLHKNGNAIHIAVARLSRIQKAPRPLQASTKFLQSILQSISGDSLEDARDRALLALRIAGAFRLSELARLSFPQISRDDHKLEIRLGGWGSHRSDLRNVLTILDDAIMQPVVLLDVWLKQGGIRGGRVFRQVSGNHLAGALMTEYHVAEAIQARAFDAGYGREVLSRIKARRGSVDLTDFEVAARPAHKG